MDKYPTNQPNIGSAKQYVGLLIILQMVVIIFTNVFLVTSSYVLDIDLNNTIFFFLVLGFSCYYRRIAINAGRGVVVHNTADFIILASIILFESITVTFITISIHIFSHFLFGLRNPLQLTFNFANEILSGSVVFIIYTEYIQGFINTTNVNLIISGYVLTLSYYILNHLQTIIVVWLVSGQSFGSILENSFDKREEFYIIVVSASAIIFTMIVPSLYPIVFILIFMLFIQQISKEMELKRKNQMNLELKQLQHEVEIIEHKELEVQKLKVLAGKVAHDIRNYLTILNGDLMLIEGQIEEKRSDRMGDALDNINNIVGYLYDFSAGNTLIFSDVEINSFVEGIVELNLLESGYRYSFKGLEEQRFLSLDTTKMKQVISNIIINAKEAINKENGLITIELEIEENDNNWVTIQIKDNGSGIAIQDQEKIFDPFFSTKQRGSGLGLTTANHIVVSHHGTLDFVSQMGEGTSFSISLPLDKVEQD